MRKFFGCLFALIISTFIISCSNFYSENTGITLVLPYGPAASAREAASSTSQTSNSQIYFFKVELFGDNFDKPEKSVQAKSGDKILFDSLVPGEYLITCQAFLDETGPVLYEGETSVEVVAGEIAKAHLQLVQVQHEVIETPEDKDPSGGEVITNPEDKDPSGGEVITNPEDKDPSSGEVITNPEDKDPSSGEVITNPDDKGDGDKTDTGSTTEGTIENKDSIKITRKDSNSVEYEWTCDSTYFGAYFLIIKADSIKDVYSAADFQSPVQKGVSVFNQGNDWNTGTGKFSNLEAGKTYVIGMYGITGSDMAASDYVWAVFTTDASESGNVSGGEEETTTEISIQYKKDFYILGSEIANSDFEVKLGGTVLKADRIEIEENAFGLKVPVKVSVGSNEYTSTIPVKINYPDISLDMVESGSSVKIPEGSDKALIAAKSGLKELVITPENATYTFYGEYSSNPNVQFGTVASGYEWYVKENDGEFTLATSELGTRYQPTLDIAGVYTYRCELDISKDYANGQYKDYIVDSKIVTNEYAFEVCDWEVLGFFNKGEETAPCESLTAGNTYILKLKNKAGVNSVNGVTWKAPENDSLVSFPEMIVSEDGQCFLQEVVIGNLDEAIEVSFSAKITDIIVEDYKIWVKPAVTASESVQFLKDLTFYVSENYLNESIVQYNSKERSLANMMNEGWTVSIADNVIDENGMDANGRKVYEHYAGFVPVKLSKDGKDYEEKVKIDFSSPLSISYNSGTEVLTLTNNAEENSLADSVELFVTYDVFDYDYETGELVTLFSTAIDEWDLTIYNEIGNSSEYFAADCNWTYKQGDSVVNESEIGSQSSTYKGARLLLKKPSDDKNQVFSVMCDCGELGSTAIGGLKFNSNLSN